jgi:hypothetical protein
MITTIKISQLSDIKGDFLTNILNAMFESFGEIEIIIKPQKGESGTEIFRRIQDVENGAELLYFTENEFDDLNMKLLAGVKSEKSKIKKIKKHETNNIISK